MKLCFLKNNFKVVSLILGLAILPGCDWFGSSNKSDLLVINVLDKELYDDCHIPGSVQVPMMDVQKHVASLPKTTKIVVYCSNHACTASPYVVKKLKKDGFENVWDYDAGMAGWYQAHYPVEGPAKAAYLHQENPVIGTHSKDIEYISTEDLKKMIDENSSK